ncbi:hypothetical protein TPHA_0C03330 [Tetrapisispora phaffii CBS 4417]|uniref:Uncharacterized protein n=1 Tax=Tetrapisispora phaffii (strain ATCC 24235 / CBS 4417 / NBRC 1672 / NRRL Y-8282 / UCD 70-5) TaxID=1071381 RepID=G8BRV9_TETPH|nr:hypothetical protein TPHA_0C03330 [Tetrapisispora phaffii CBS 4417]CCE62485.1 hypothetical protein TPHA_0C03330 [Tetrapisispora phaffii CBS 4417]
MAHASKTELLSLYKNLIKSAVRHDRRYKIIQEVNEINKEVTLLKYEKLKLAKSQQLLKDSNSTMALNLKAIEKKLVELKNANPSKNREFYFSPLEFRNLIRPHFEKQIRSSTGQDMINKRTLEHYKDIYLFLDNQREYDELFERYNMGEFNKMAQNVRVQKTAKRVGLEVPL